MTWKSSLLMLVFIFLPLISTSAVGAIEEVGNNEVEILDGEVDKDGNTIGEEDLPSTYGPWEDADVTATAAAEVTTERQFETLGLKNHYETWMRMIMQSDYVKNNGSVNYNDTDDDVNETDKEANNVRNETKGVDKEAKGEDNDANTLNEEANVIADEVSEAPGGVEVAEAATSANNRLRILQKLVYPDHRIIDPVPARVSTKCECGLFNSPRQKIVGGTETYEHHYPWMVSLQLARNKKHFCGASIISDSYILTAAHCTDGLFPLDLLLRVGDHDLTRRDVSREYSIPVYQIYQHPRYNRITTDNDISLMRVKEPLVLTWRVSPICLTPPDLTFYKESVVVMGWGKESEKADLGSPRLRHVSLQILPMGKCRHNFKFLSEEISSNMLCALLGTKDTCQGDSGGPLTWYDEENRRYFLIGVTSWGIGCGLPNYPGVYTKVGKYLDWIYDTTGDSTFCTSYHPRADVKKVKQKPKIYKLDDFMLPDLGRPWKRKGSRGKKRKKGRKNMKRLGRWDLKRVRYGKQKHRGEMGNGKWKKTQINDGKSLIKKAQRKYPGKERQEKASKKLRKRKKFRKETSRLRNLQGRYSTWEKWREKMEKKRRKQELLKKRKSKLRKAQEKYSAQKKRQEETGQRRRKQQKNLKEGKSKTRKIHRQQQRLRNRSKVPKRREKKKRRKKKKKGDDKRSQLACSKATKRKRNKKRPNSLQEESQEKD
ncbi:uncharacterized protein [Cherax quadricarinatus]